MRALQIIFRRSSFATTVEPPLLAPDTFGFGALGGAPVAGGRAGGCGGGGGDGGCSQILLVFRSRSPTCLSASSSHESTLPGVIRCVWGGGGKTLSKALSSHSH